MGEKSLSDQISNLMNDTPELATSAGEQETNQQQDVLAESLQAVAGQSDESLETALEEFMSGKGVLHEASRAAATRGGSGLTEIIKLLTSQFKLSPAVAKMMPHHPEAAIRWR